jgi:protein ImuB
MGKRFVSIWFRYLKTDWYTRRDPRLGNSPFVLVSPDHGRLVITAANYPAEAAGAHIGMPLADARALIPGIMVQDDVETISGKLLHNIAEWCIRFTPVVAVDIPDGIILDVTGCSHLWGGEKKYLTTIFSRFKSLGYNIHIGMADTIGMAWAAARYKKEEPIIEAGTQSVALADLPPEALRIDDVITERLYQLGLDSIGGFIDMPRSALRRRFGEQVITRLNQALGTQMEFIEPVIPFETYQDRLNVIDPVATRAGIEIALEQLLEKLCGRLSKEGKGIRSCLFTGYRVDNKVQSIGIKTIKPSFNAKHLFKLFENKIESIEPDLGIELFTITADKVEDVITTQESIWNGTGGLQDTNLAELLDRLSGRFGTAAIARYLPQEHYWPEHSFKVALSLDEKRTVDWGFKPRPLQLLTNPEMIEVTSIIPDYPPMLFRYKGRLHKIVKADGPERIEQEWWIQKGVHRDYYAVEDDEGHRYWVFRSGPYDDEKKPQWFVHGFFA